MLTDSKSPVLCSWPAARRNRVKPGRAKLGSVPAQSKEPESAKTFIPIIDRIAGRGEKGSLHQIGPCRRLS